MRIVIPSVGYADTLAVTLPRWRQMFRDAWITVVTAPEDTNTLALTRSPGLADHVLVTSVWTANGRIFDKAAALDEAFGFTGHQCVSPIRGERCLSVDADVFPFGMLPRHIEGEAIYGCPRYHCPSPSYLKQHETGEIRKCDLLLMGKSYNDGPPLIPNPTIEQIKHATMGILGYLQMWAHRPGRDRFGSFPTAARYDLQFRNSFTARHALTDFYVLHLGDATRRNWTGRVVPPWGFETGAEHGLNA